MAKMKIALIGNMNNNFFCLARYLRDRGFDAELLYPNDVDHFLPPCDTYTLDYQQYTRELNWNQESFYTVKTQEVEALLEPYDATIVCGYAAAILSKAGRKIDIYIPYGSDIYKYSHLPAEHHWLQKARNFAKSKLRYPKHKPLDMSQGTPHKFLKKGIQEARYVICEDTNPDFEAQFERLKIQGKRLKFSIPFIYTPQYNPQTLERFFDRSHWYQEFKRIRETYDVVIFHHARHTWKTYANDFTFKGNDKLIRGFADFVKKEKDAKACLVTMEYGHDYLESKKLIMELGIEKNVIWFPKMYRKDLMIGIHLSDICTGEFDKSWFMFGTIMEGMAMAKPILHYREDGLYQKDYPEMYPLMNARTPEQISAALSDYVKRPEYYKTMGEEGYRWFQKYIVDIPLSHIESLLNEGVN